VFQCIDEASPNYLAHCFDITGIIICFWPFSIYLLSHRATPASPAFIDVTCTYLSNLRKPVTKTNSFCIKIERCNNLVLKEATDNQSDTKLVVCLSASWLLESGYCNA
jgi:hypothetical protein